MVAKVKMPIICWGFKFISESSASVALVNLLLFSNIDNKVRTLNLFFS